MRKEAAIYVAGGQTLLGSAILRQLERQGFRNLHGHASREPELADRAAVDAFFADVLPEYVFDAGGRSGGIAANTKYPAELIYDNLLAAAHVVHAAHRQRVKKLLYLASSCTYPKLCRQPMREADLLSGPPEPTSAAYATAKLAGIKLCQAYRQQYGDDFIVGIPANAFGLGDDFSPEDSHVIAALIRKMHEAKTRGSDVVGVWGSGEARREFVFADDVAQAAILVMHRYSDAEPINLGGGCDLSIRELAERISRVVGFAGRLEFDASKADGMPLKALDSGKLLALGWRPSVAFDEALARTYQDYLQSQSEDKPK